MIFLKQKCEMIFTSVMQDESGGSQVPGDLAYLGDGGVSSMTQSEWRRVGKSESL